MSESSYTPGPYRVAEIIPAELGGFVDRAPEGHRRYTSSGHDTHCLEVLSDTAHMENVFGSGLGGHLATIPITYDGRDQALANGRLFAAAPAMHAALRNLVAADNCNYDRHLMRYEGYFDQARAALEMATGERLPHPDGPQAGKSIIVIVEEREAQIAALRAALEYAIRQCAASGHLESEPHMVQAREALTFNPNKH